MNAVKRMVRWPRRPSALSLSTKTRAGQIKPLTYENRVTLGKLGHIRANINPLKKMCVLFRTLVATVRNPLQPLAVKIIKRAMKLKP